MTRTPEQDAWLAGYERGVQSGYDAGYREAVDQITREVHTAWTNVFSASAIIREQTARERRRALGLAPTREGAA